MPRKKRDVRSALEKKGFSAREGHHHYFCYHDLKGARTKVFTKISHSSKNDLDDNLLGRMARQCKLPRADFDRLIECPMDHDEYDTILRQAGNIS